MGRYVGTFERLDGPVDMGTFRAIHADADDPETADEIIGASFAEQAWPGEWELLRIESIG